MSRRRHLAATWPALVLLAASLAAAAEPEWSAIEATRTRINTIGIEGGTPEVVLDAPRRFAAPEWSPDGKALIVNGGGRLWRLPASGGGKPEPIKVAIDHPARATGHFQIAFCFDNGAVTGDGAGVTYNDRGWVRKGYRLRGGGYVFGD